MLCIWRIRVHVIILWNSCMAIGYFFRWSNSWTSIDGRKNLVTYFCIILLIIHVSECLNPYIYLRSCIEMCGYLLFSILFLFKIHPCTLTTGMFITFLEQKCPVYYVWVTLNLADHNVLVFMVFKQEILPLITDIILSFIYW